MRESSNEEHAAEVERRWGGTEAYRQSRARTKSYTDSDWADIKAELESIEAGFAATMSRGVPANAEEAVELAERARRHIDERYYTCSHEMHVKLAEMYTADERFRAHYDERVDGLAEYVAAAITANAEKHRR